jgi:hypothetical protein
MNGGVDADEPPTGAVQQAFSGSSTCQEWMCGTNSPEIANFGFWDLNLPPSLGTPGKRNNADFQLLYFVQKGDKYLPKVAEGRLTASNSTGTLSGSALVGGWLVLVRGSRSFKLRVTEVGRAISWAQQPGKPLVVLESYKLDWTEFTGGSNGKEFVNVCSNPPSQESGDLLHMLQFHTLLFEGDRIDAKPKLDTGVDNSWFNLGCAGSALAKMALTGHTEASRHAGTFNTSLEERQTILKMFAGDYCGDGTPFTVAGQPLSWVDDALTMKLAAVPLKRESRWYEKGAACLDDARIDVHPTTLSTATFGTTPSIYEQVAAHCPDRMPPACDGGTFDTDKFHLLSATPTP